MNFALQLPPHPRPPQLDALLAPYEVAKPSRRHNINKALEQFVADVYFCQGSGSEPPPIPKLLAKLDPALVAFLVHSVPQEFKQEHWQNGWSTRPQEEKDAIILEIQKQKEEEGFYSHLPKIGETITHKEKDGSTSTKIVDEKTLRVLRTLVDNGALPPAQTQKPAEPDFTVEQMLNQKLIDHKLQLSN
jgi:hypothetical protein